jgi:hypothetical protein
MSAYPLRNQPVNDAEKIIVSSENQPELLNVAVSTMSNFETLYEVIDIIKSYNLQTGECICERTYAYTGSYMPTKMAGW